MYSDIRCGFMVNGKLAILAGIPYNIFVNRKFHVPFCKDNQTDSPTDTCMPV
jgi:hypothetical protein